MDDDYDVFASLKEYGKDKMKSRNMIFEYPKSINLTDNDCNTDNVIIHELGKEANEKRSRRGKKDDDNIDESVPVSIFKTRRKNKNKSKSISSSNDQSFSQPSTSTCTTVSPTLTENNLNERRSSNRLQRKRRKKRNSIAGLTVLPCIDLTTNPIPQSTSEVVNLDSDDDSAKINHPPKKLDDEQNFCLSVKVKWGTDIDIFPLRKHQRFYDVLKHYANRENVDIEYICLNLGEKIITESDTPDSLNYKIYMFIHGRKMNNPVMTFPIGNTKNPNLIELKIQCAGRKRPITIPLRKMDSFKELYVKLSEEINVPASKIILRFDGEPIRINSTPEELDFEDGEVIDCIVKE